VSDETNNTSGFKDDNDQNSQDLVDDYSYDANGNMTSDQNKNINLITYNHLNLPKTINFGSLGSINYIYNALGQKVKKTVLEDGATNATDYLDGYQYLNKYLKYFPTAEGYVNAWQDTGIIQQGSYLFNYVYSYTDHLGNIRLSYAKDPKTNTLKILEQNHYYPFGLKHENYNSERKIFAKEEAEILQQGQTGAANVMALNGLNVSGRMKIVPGGGGGGPVVYGERNYKYQGQERQDELGLNWDSFKYRNYDYAIGRFMSIDPLSEKYSYQSHYNFSENRVIDARELEGLEALRLTGAGGYSSLMTKPSTSYQQKSASLGFSMLHPIAANSIGTIERGSTNISSVSGRIARHMTDGGNMSGGIGSESNAFRHALWSATMSNQFGNEISTQAGNAHEGVKALGSLSVDFSQPLVQNADLADSVVDVLNNEIGRSIAEGLGENASQVDIGMQVLNVQKTEGLWQVSTDKDGNMTISRQKISEKQYNAGVKTLKSLDNNGFNEKDRKDLENN
jgi:RHS repeat-associated protein